jgi:hypothetical protein
LAQEPVLRAASRQLATHQHWPQGVDPDSALHVYRAGVLALRIKSVREGASLTVEDDEYGTPRLRKIRGESRGAASPMRNSETDLTEEQAA